MFIPLAQLLTYCTSSVATIGKLLPVSYKELTGGKITSGASLFCPSLPS